jgi:hypothetical protein
MKCHYIVDRGKRILIPGCMGTAAHNDRFYCTCSDIKKDRLQILEEKVVKIEKQLTLINKNHEKD